MLHLEDVCRRPVIRIGKAARSSRCNSKRLIVRRWTKNCEPPVIGPAFVKAAHTNPTLQTPRQFFRDAGKTHQTADLWEFYLTASAQRNFAELKIPEKCTKKDHTDFAVFIF
ncbi:MULTISPECIES: hypothetical protein [Thalassospira]|jgi:hypothetical protein|uniref:hypothetical protein n=1 Tax=Thalassospira TaxID=168934 RepID=UPI001BCE761C|nr:MULTISPECIES: hypothetical protein [Thalassospira]|tara:strand:- start:10900 stop:11235 length:336 start_codon:yes stop_codon:yes gene_type:complete